MDKNLNLHKKQPIRVVESNRIICQINQVFMIVKETVCSLATLLALSHWTSYFIFSSEYHWFFYNNKELFYRFYSGFHIYFLVFFTFFDLLSNILFFIVLSQKELRNSGFNLTMMMIAFCNFNNVVMKLIEEMFDRITGSEKPYFKAFYKRIYAYLKLYLSSMANCLVVEIAFCRVMALYTTNR